MTPLLVKLVPVVPCLVKSELAEGEFSLQDGPLEERYNHIIIIHYHIKVIQNPEHNYVNIGRRFS